MRTLSEIDCDRFFAEEELAHWENQIDDLEAEALAVENAEAEGESEE